MKSTIYRSKNLLALLLSLTVIYSCTIEKKTDKETLKQAMTEMIQEAADSAAAKEYMRKKTGQTLQVHNYKCRYFITKMIKCDFEVENKSTEPMKNIDIWYDSYRSTQHKISTNMAMTTGNFPLQPGEKKVLNITMSTTPEKTKYLEFQFKTGPKKHFASIQRLNVDDIQKSEF